MARLNGKQIGRPSGSYETRKSKEVKRLIRELSQTYGGTYKDMDIMNLTHVSRNSYYKYKKECLEQDREAKRA